MQRWKLLIEYEGTPYCGWQRQADQPSVQEEIEKALHSFSGEKAILQVAGRTDTGVHALGQVAHFELEKKTNANEIMGALNAYLGKEAIAILNVEAVDDEFHARFKAMKRFYHYKILIRRPKPALDQNRYWHLKHDLNLPAMEKAAQHLVGNHDFSSFRAAMCQAKTPIKSIDKIYFKTGTYHDGQSKVITMFIEAPSFLYHQVRNIMGSLVMVGEGKWEPDHIKTVLEAKDRTQAGPAAPACGLYFEKVLYP